LRLLRGHGLITKIAKTHRYQVTEKGRTSLSVILAARQASNKVLLQAA
jgi:DNA-binding PadR family transcriptional regulator